MLAPHDARPIVDDGGAPSHGLWAPDMLAANGRYYFYYSIGPQHPTPSRLGVATCEAPAGPCIDSGQPLLTGGGGFEAIDPMVFADAKSGKTYRSEEHTSELQSLMRISYADFCLKKKTKNKNTTQAEGL